MIADDAQSQRPGILDQHTQDPTSAWQRADRLPRHLIHTLCEEPFKLAALGVQYAQSGIASPGELTGHVEHAIEDRFDVELCHEEPAYLEEPAKAVVFEMRLGRPQLAPIAGLVEALLSGHRPVASARRSAC